MRSLNPFTFNYLQAGGSPRELKGALAGRVYAISTLEGVGESVVTSQSTVEKRAPSLRRLLESEARLYTDVTSFTGYSRELLGVRRRDRSRYLLDCASPEEVPVGHQSLWSFKLTSKAFASLSLGLARSATLGHSRRFNSGETLKGFRKEKSQAWQSKWCRTNPFRVLSISNNPNYPKVALRANPGLEFANAFGVYSGGQWCGLGPHLSC
jgi:hypothetical protein